MRLYEFQNTNNLRVQLTGIISQIRGRIQDTDDEQGMSVEALLNILDDEGIHISDQKFREMVKEPPLSNLIANVEGDQVVFNSQDASVNNKAEAPDNSSKTLDKMAKRAAKKDSDI